MEANNPSSLDEFMNNKKVSTDTRFLARTLSNDSGMWQVPEADPNYQDIIRDRTGGSIYFYSPSNAEWGNTTTGMEAALISGTTVFPDAGQFETDTICGSENNRGMLFNYCRLDTNQVRRAYNIQVVVVPGIPANSCAGENKNMAPQFIFLRFRDSSSSAVVWGN